jgi:hypothetical protein
MPNAEDGLLKEAVLRIWKGASKNSTSLVPSYTFIKGMLGENTLDI